MAVPDEITSKPYASFHTYKPSGEYFVAVREHVIEVEIPDDFDPRPLAAEAIDTQIAEVRAEMTAKVMELLARKSQLLALEMSA